ncbi:hypothetical protein B0H13DRAFT_2438961 [Mycena leptocephala]|nr:hypothetical protein B0H13DRAFT_2438961 [Mycena leptocephala]
MLLSSSPDAVHPPSQLRLLVSPRPVALRRVWTPFGFFAAEARKHYLASWESSMEQLLFISPMLCERKLRTPFAAWCKSPSLPECIRFTHGPSLTLPSSHRVLPHAHPNNHDGDNNASRSTTKPRLRPPSTSMYRSKFRSLHIDHNSIASAMQDEDSADALLDSAITLLQMGREAPKRSWFTTSRTLRLSSLILHSALVTTHLALVGIWARGLEHRFTVTLENQKFVSFLISATTTAFGTIYSALLVFATQTLSMRRSLQMDQVLTATHDNAAAWAGVGAAISHLWLQKTVPAHASMIEVLTAALYLMAILGLHITTSSLFSLVTVYSTRSFGAPTHGLPSFNSSDALDFDEFGADSTGSSAYLLPSVLGNATNPGLHEGTLYDVLSIDPVPGNATVHASGFNVTCGYVVNVSEVQKSSDSIFWTSAGYSIPATQPGMISTSLGLSSSSSIILYSTIPIMDSSFKTGPLVTVSPPMDMSVSAIQIFRCSLSLINQTATVDAQSQQIQTETLGPDFKKNGVDLGAIREPTEQCDNQWELLDRHMGDMMAMASTADIYLIQKLNLPVANHNTSTLNVTLHEVENALSTIVASMFWTYSNSSGSFPPTYTAVAAGAAAQGMSDPLSDAPTPILLQGNATVTERFTQARLELSIIAVSAGLAISIILFLLALPSLLFHQGSTDDKDRSVNGTGILHAIWLYRNHPELDALLEQVEHPTDDNLRSAGLVQTRLVGGRVQKERSNESF